ncbi:unnamed protein product [Amoebophrya sp. A25]|nr:unnamed protein product [Amoebophrya sp. A25]|eukprot:GSA25T00012265001.1
MTGSLRDLASAVSLGNGAWRPEDLARRLCVVTKSLELETGTSTSSTATTFHKNDNGTRYSTSRSNVPVGGFTGPDPLQKDAFAACKSPNPRLAAHSSSSISSGAKILEDHKHLEKIGEYFASLADRRTLAPAVTQTVCCAFARLGFRHDRFFKSVQTAFLSSPMRLQSLPDYVLCNLVNAFVRLGYVEGAFTKSRDLQQSPCLSRAILESVDGCLTYSKLSTTDVVSLLYAFARIAPERASKRNAPPSPLASVFRNGARTLRERQAAMPVDHATSLLNSFARAVQQHQCLLQPVEAVPLSQEKRSDESIDSPVNDLPGAGNTEESTVVDQTLFDHLAQSVLVAGSASAADISVTMNAYAKANWSSPRLLQVLANRMLEDEGQRVMEASAANLVQVVHALARFDEFHYGLLHAIERRLLDMRATESGSDGQNGAHGRASSSSSSALDGVPKIDGAVSAFFPSAKEIANIAHGYCRLRTGSRPFFDLLFAVFATKRADWDPQSVAQILDVCRKRSLGTPARGNSGDSETSATEVEVDQPRQGIFPTHERDSSSRRRTAQEPSAHKSALLSMLEEYFEENLEQFNAVAAAQAATSLVMMMPTPVAASSMLRVLERVHTSSDRNPKERHSGKHRRLPEQSGRINKPNAATIKYVSKLLEHYKTRFPEEWEKLRARAQPEWIDTYF